MNTSILLAYTLKEKHFTLNIYLQTQLLIIYQKLLNIQFLKGGIYEI